MVEFGYAAGWRLVRGMPGSLARATFRTAADLAYLRRGPAVRRLDANLRRVVGPELPDSALDRLVRQGVRSYARYWLEAFRLPGQSPEQIRRGFRLTNQQLLADAIAAGKGVVVALPHAGNWDAAGAWVAAQGWSLTTVAERLRPEGLYERFVAYREGLGMKIIPLRGGERPPLELLEDRLRQGDVVPLLADRDLSTRGIDVTFFGGRTRMPAGPAILALRTGAPLFTVTMWYEPEAAYGELQGPLSPPATGPLDQRVRLLTQQVADQLAAGIAAHPADWHMLQRVWLDRPQQQVRSPDGSPAQRS
ncbi:phosphatidylinositol mannoside acyltransferase [Natronosporangium hydrolyticum]|uniref:Phosphatidylinositol mannoside acyltransferase n=1 Tax=Natronosporangium hydrolyticum TaxID=2811111 RepID=A0A895YPN6_9ACTN|nr:phosphatidylinositol mannoside acyltransferase [Natronosporangium hydrolyticum]